mmetsp:Transcript_18842/g.47342  ORF Transcript_18842/g.47342 Transcript_18842/m.47342 type:complete len:287 (+) Transcript_18842:454-1314(+)
MGSTHFLEGLRRGETSLSPPSTRHSSMTRASRIRSFAFGMQRFCMIPSMTLKECLVLPPPLLPQKMTMSASVSLFQPESMPPDSQPFFHVSSGDWEEIPEDTEIREEELKKKDAKSRAEVLEMIGDLPDADVKPPDHVLFICKLNKVTRSSDLDLIFSRFGECQADIIKDQKTGDSLCYGFIEFETKKACEDAYFKMNNCLIDDRRIKVDFSQSVSKLWNDFRRGKGGRPQFVDKPAAYQNPSKAGGSGMVFDTPMLRREALAEGAPGFANFSGPRHILRSSFLLI